MPFGRVCDAYNFPSHSASLSVSFGACHVLWSCQYAVKMISIFCSFSLVLLGGCIIGTNRTHIRSTSMPLTHSIFHSTNSPLRPILYANLIKSSSLVKLMLCCVGATAGLVLFAIQFCVYVGINCVCMYASVWWMGRVEYAECNQLIRNLRIAVCVCAERRRKQQARRCCTQIKMYVMEFDVQRIFHVLHDKRFCAYNNTRSAEAESSKKPVH